SMCVTVPSAGATRASADSGICRSGSRKKPTARPHRATTGTSKKKKTSCTVKVRVSSVTAGKKKKKAKENNFGQAHKGKSQIIAFAKFVVLGSEPEAADVPVVLQIAGIEDVVRAVGAISLAFLGY